jgi:hypothetical protein
MPVSEMVVAEDIMLEDVVAKKLAQAIPVSEMVPDSVVSPNSEMVLCVHCGMSHAAVADYVFKEV